MHLRLGLADTHVSFTLHTGLQESNLVTVTQRLLGDVAAQTGDCRGPHPSRNNIADAVGCLYRSGMPVHSDLEAPASCV